MSSTLREISPQCGPLGYPRSSPCGCVPKANSQLYQALSGGTPGVGLRKGRADAGVAVRACLALDDQAVAVMQSDRYLGYARQAWTLEHAAVYAGLGRTMLAKFTDVLADTANKSRGRWTILLDRENGILAQEIVERLVRAADGSLVLATVGSTMAIASIVTHAGIVRVRRFAFDLPTMAESGMRIAP
jgi:hypothetical protein